MTTRYGPSVIKGFRKIANYKLVFGRGQLVFQTIDKRFPTHKGHILCVSSSGNLLGN